jgi:hypothetical protein
MKQSEGDGPPGCCCSAAVLLWLTQTPFGHKGI